LIDPLAESLVTGTLQLIVQAVEAKLYALLMIGVDEPGKRHFLVIEDGVRESTQSWRAVLLGLKSHGMNYAGVGRWRWCHWFWVAVEENYSDTRAQSCWMHRTMNVLDCLPKSSQPRAKQSPRNIRQARIPVDAEKMFDLFIRTYEPRYPKATLCLQRGREELMAFYNFPAQSW